MNERLQVNEDQYGLQITLKWFQWQAYFLIFFCIGWNTFLFGWYSNSGMPFFFYLFPIIHVAVGVGLTYYTLALFFNKTLLTVDSSQIIVKSGPLPWLGNKTIYTEEIIQLYVKEKIHHHKNSTSSTYELKVKFKDGDSTVLIGFGIISDVEYAMFLEEKLEKFLNIKDTPVRGEYKKY